MAALSRDSTEARNVTNLSGHSCEQNTMLLGERSDLHQSVHTQQGLGDKETSFLPSGRTCALARDC
jgi:hypothetical protein